MLGGLQHRLMDDELLALFCDEYTKQINALRMAESAGRAKDEARLNQIDRAQDRIIDAIADGTLTGAKIKGRMHKLEAEAADIRARLADSPKEEKTLLHPKMGARYRQAVTNLRQALDRKDGRPEAVEILRSLIDRIVLNPDKAATKGYLIDIEGELAGTLSLCAANKNAADVSESGIQQ